MSIWKRTAYLGFIAAILMTVLLIFAAYGRTQETTPESRVSPEEMPVLIIIFFCTMTIPILTNGAFFLTLRELAIPESHLLVRPVIGLLIQAGIGLQLVGVGMVQASSLDSIVFPAHLSILLVESFFEMGSMMFVLVVGMFAIAMRSLPHVPRWLWQLTAGFAGVGFIANPFLREPQWIAAASMIVIPTWIVIISSLMLTNQVIFSQDSHIRTR